MPWQRVKSSLEGNSSSKASRLAEVFTNSCWSEFLDAAFASSKPQVCLGVSAKSQSAPAPRQLCFALRAHTARDGMEKDPCVAGAAGDLPAEGQLYACGAGEDFRAGKSKGGFFRDSFYCLEEESEQSKANASGRTERFAGLRGDMSCSMSLQPTPALAQVLTKTLLVMVKTMFQPWCSDTFPHNYPAQAVSPRWWKPPSSECWGAAVSTTLAPRRVFSPPVPLEVGKQKAKTSWSFCHDATGPLTWVTGLFAPWTHQFFLGCCYKQETCQTSAVKKTWEKKQPPMKRIIQEGAWQTIWCTDTFCRAKCLYWSELCTDTHSRLGRDQDHSKGVNKIMSVTSIPVCPLTMFPFTQGNIPRNRCYLLSGNSGCVPLLCWTNAPDNAGSLPTTISS